MSFSSGLNDEPASSSFSSARCCSPSPWSLPLQSPSGSSATQTSSSRPSPPPALSPQSVRFFFDCGRSCLRGIRDRGGLSPASHRLDCRPREAPKCSCSPRLDRGLPGRQRPSSSPLGVLCPPVPGVTGRGHNGSRGGASSRPGGPMHWMRHANCTAGWDETAPCSVSSSWIEGAPQRAKHDGGCRPHAVSGRPQRAVDRARRGRDTRRLPRVHLAALAGRSHSDRFAGPKPPLQTRVRPLLAGGDRDAWRARIGRVR